jgi:hypothetical protein
VAWTLRAALLSIFLCFVAIARAQGAESSTALLLHVYPEVVLERAGPDAVRLKVRLPRGAEGRLWAEDSCGAPRENAHVVTRSGVHLVPLAALEAGAGQSLCFASSSAGLTASLAPLQAASRANPAAGAASGK